MNNRKVVECLGWLIVILVMLAGLHLRLVSVSETEVIAPLRSDAGEYFCYAYNMKYNNVYSRHCFDVDADKIRPDAIRTPGYPLFLLSFIDGPPTLDFLDKVLLSQVLVSMLTLLASFYLFRIMLGNFYWAIGAALLTAFSPHLIAMNSYVLTETLFSFLIIVFLLCMILALKKQHVAWLFLPGLILGLACLVRPVVQYFPLFLLILFLAKAGWKRGTQQFLFLLLGFLLAFGPWVARNIVTLDKFSDDRLTINFLHHGMYPDFTYEGVPHSYGFPYRFDPDSSEISKSTGSVLREILRRFKEEPGRHLKWFIIDKPNAFWSWSIVQGQGDVFVYPVASTPYDTKSEFIVTRIIMIFLHPLVILMAAGGCMIVWLSPKRGSPELRYDQTAVQLCALLLIYFTAVHMIGAPFPRYSVPLRPILFGMSIFGLTFLIAYIAGLVRKTRVKNGTV